MKLLAALLLGYFVVFGQLGDKLRPDAAAPKLAHRAIAGPVNDFLDKAVSPELAIVPEPPRVDAALDEPVRFTTRRGRVVNMPDGCRTVGQPYDLVVFFHGAPTAVEPAFERSGIDGVLFIMNLGAGSGRYEQTFEWPGSFAQLLEGAKAAVASACPNAVPEIRRVALSGWSAGYGAIWRILEREIDDRRIDAVLLSDGLHAGFVEEGSQRDVNPAQLAPFALFADAAVKNERLFAVAHTAIVPPDYASTTETANYLLRSVGAVRSPVHLEGPRPQMVQSSRASLGSFHVLGFDGGDEAAHCDQLHAVGETLFPLLRAHWRDDR
jgi:hypothetical protein